MSVSILWLIPAFVIGFVLGLLVISLCVTAGHNEAAAQLLEATMNGQRSPMGGTTEVSTVKSETIGRITLTMERGDGYRILEDHSGMIHVGPWLDHESADWIFTEKVSTLQFLAHVAVPAEAIAEKEGVR